MTIVSIQLICFSCHQNDRKQDVTVGGKRWYRHFGPIFRQPRYTLWCIVSFACSDPIPDQIVHERVNGGTERDGARALLMLKYTSNETGRDWHTSCQWIRHQMSESFSLCIHILSFHYYTWLYPSVWFSILIKNPKYGLRERDRKWKDLNFHVQPETFHGAGMSNVPHMPIRLFNFRCYQKDRKRDVAVCGIDIKSWAWHGRGWCGYIWGLASFSSGKIKNEIIIIIIMTIVILDVQRDIEGNSTHTQKITIVR